MSSHISATVVWRTKNGVRLPEIWYDGHTTIESLKVVDIDVSFKVPQNEVNDTFDDLVERYKPREVTNAKEA
jgi:hypothetical protein